ncbi:MAG: transcriptional repressor [Cyanobacteriota bacterium]
MNNKSKQLVLKQTHQEILNIVTDNCALNAYEIFELLKKRNLKNISQTTIYRALNYLVEHYLIKPISLNDGHTRYEAITKDNHHHHFICTECKTLFPLEYCPIKENPDLLPEKFEVKFHNFELFGICSKCHQ